MNILPLLALSALGTLSYPQAVLTNVGGTSYISENDRGAEITGVQIFISAGLERQPPNASGIAALLAESIANTPVTPEGSDRSMPLRAAVARASGLITYTVEGRDVHYYIEGRGRNMPSLLHLFAQALGKPDLSPATLSAARKTLIARVGENESNPLSVGLEMFKRSYYLNGAGLSALGNASSLERITGADVMKFYDAAYKRGDMSFSAAGRITPEMTLALQSVASVLPEGKSEPLPLTVKELSASNGTRIVAQRDVGAPFLVMGFAAPSPADKDFGAMMLLESLLANSFDRQATTTPNLAERTISAFYLYDSTPASFIVFVNGARIEPTSALREVLLVIDSLANKPLQNASLKRFKAVATGTLLSNTLTIADRSYLLGTLNQEGLGADALNEALAALERTTAADVQRVAERYLQKYIVAIVLPRSEQQQ